MRDAAMHITLYSNIIKMGNTIYIIEIFKNENEKKYLKLKKIEEQPDSYDLRERKVSYYKSGEESGETLLLTGRNGSHSYKMKKELTIDLETLLHGEYEVRIKASDRNESVMKLHIYR